MECVDIVEVLRERHWSNTREASHMTTHWSLASIVTVWYRTPVILNYRSAYGRTECVLVAWKLDEFSRDETAYFNSCFVTTKRFSIRAFKMSKRFLQTQTLSVESMRNCGNGNAFLAAIMVMVMRHYPILYRTVRYCRVWWCQALPTCRLLIGIYLQT